MPPLRPATALLLALAAHAAHGKDSVATFVLPSGVRVTIVEAPAAGRFLPNCRTGAAAVAQADYKPTTYVKRIIAEYRGKRIALDASCMADAWNGRPLEVPGAIRYFGGSCKALDSGLYCAFRGIFADGSETFAAEWTVAAGRSYRTVFSGSQDIISLFSTNIDPPNYE